MSDLRAVNARLRQVVADKDELIALQERLLAAERERSQLQGALVAGQVEQINKQGEMLRLQAEQIDAQAKLIKGLQDEVAELKRRLGTDSTNSSSPPSKDSIAAKARQRRRGRSRSGSGRRSVSRVGRPGIPDQG